MRFVFEVSPSATDNRADDGDVAVAISLWISTKQNQNKKTKKAIIKKLKNEKEKRHETKQKGARSSQYWHIERHRAA